MGYKKEKQLINIKKINMKYKLININTKEETLCDKVTIDGFDYYISKTDIGINDYFEVDGQLFKCLTSQEADDLAVSNDYPKVIATNNLNIYIPKVVDEVEILAHAYFAEERFNWEEKNPDGLKSPQSLIEHYNKTFTPLYKAGYNKSQESHPFSEKDMVEFANWIINQDWDETELNFPNNSKSTEELLQLWKEQQPKIIYYNG